MASANIVNARLNMRISEPSLEIRNISLEEKWGSYTQKFQPSLSWGTPVIVSITVISFLIIVSRALAS